MSTTRITTSAKSGKLYDSKVSWTGTQLVIEKPDGTDLSRTTMSEAEASALVKELTPEPEPEPEPPPSEKPWVPYAPTSPFNTEVTSYDVHPKSQAVVNNILSMGGPSKLVIDEVNTWDYSHPRYHAKSTDPLYTIKLDQTWRGSTAGEKIRIPNGARWAGYPSSSNPTDRHFTVVQPDGWEYDFHKTFSISNGIIHANFGSKLRIDGDGRGGGSTVANFGCLAGMIRSEELIAGQINHALFCTVKQSDGTNVYPALTDGSGAHGSNPDIWPPLGAHFLLTYSDSEINALNIPSWKKPIIRAMAHYGAYFGDTGGPGFAFFIESSETYRSFGQTDPAVQWAKDVGIPFDGKYRIDLRTGVDWSRLKLIT